MPKQFVGFWIDSAEYERMRSAAQRLYEGNVSLFARQSIRQSLDLGLRALETAQRQTPRPTWPGREQDE